MTDQAGQNYSVNRFSRIYFLTVGISTFLALINALAFVNQLGVDILFGDRSVTWEAILLGEPALSGFFQQHGPHYQGLMYVFTLISHWIFGWNTIGDLYVNVLVMAMMIPMGLKLKKRITGSYHWVDVLIPWVILNTYQWETLLVNPYIHVMLPLFGLWLGNRLLKDISIYSAITDAIIMFLATFSTYAFILLPTFVIIRVIRCYRSKQWFALAIYTLASVSLAVFFLSDFNSTGNLSESEWLIGRGIITAVKLFAGFTGFAFVPYGNYFITILLLLFTTVVTLKLLKLKIPRPQVLIFLLSGVLIFGELLAMGRPDDYSGFYAISRYMTFMTLGFWIAFIWGLSSAGKYLIPVQLILVVLMTTSLLQPFNPKKSESAIFHEWAIELDDCLSKNKDLAKCGTMEDQLFSIKEDQIDRGYFLLRQKQAGD